MGLLLAVLLVLALLNLAATYAVWVVVCDMANTDRHTQAWAHAADVFASHLSDQDNPRRTD